MNSQPLLTQRCRKPSGFHSHWWSTVFVLRCMAAFVYYFEESTKTNRNDKAFIFKESHEDCFNEERCREWEMIRRYEVDMFAQETRRRF